MRCCKKFLQPGDDSILNKFQEMAGIRGTVHLPEGLKCRTEKLPENRIPVDVWFAQKRVWRLPGRRYGTGKNAANAGFVAEIQTTGEFTLL
jgi:hypothetical protein